MLFFVLGLFTIYLVAGQECAVGRLNQTAVNVNPKTLPHAVDFRLANPNEEDINISGYDTLLLQDQKYNLTNKINAEDYSVIVVRNATLTLSPSDGSGISLVLKNQSRLLVSNSTINFNSLTYGDCQIVLQNEAKANFSTTTLTGWGYVTGRDTSEVYVENSNISDSVFGLHSPGLASFGKSTIIVEDSSIDGVYVWENSTTSIHRSDVQIVRTAWAESGKTVINVTDSTLNTIETFLFPGISAGTAVINITDSTVAEVSATGNTTVWLLNSSVNQINLDGEARVMLGWNTYLFGLVWIPYSLIPIMQAASVLTVVVGVAAVAYAIWLRRKVKSCPKPLASDPQYIEHYSTYHHEDP